MYRLLRYDWPLHFVLFFTNWLPDNVLFLRLRGTLARPFLKECGRDFRLGRNVTLYNPSKIRIGSSVYLAYGNWLCAGAEISIGDEVLMGPYNVVISSAHTSINGSFRYGKSIQEPITIDAGAWVSSHCVVTGGSVIGSGTCIAANAVVKGVCEEGSLYAGTPAKRIKEV